MANGPLVPTHSSPLIALRAASTASAPLTRRYVNIVCIAGSSSLANGYRDPLDHSTVFVASRILAIIDGKVATNEVGPHGCILPSKGLGGANNVRLVLTVVDADDAGVPGSAGVGFVKRLWPVTASAETCTIGYWILERGMLFLGGCESPPQS
ncbi:hypothetical protein BDW59DRAFT_4025 [Aspergillus cavernicola]|uniref:Uncharacterized protein n=1 Tax=Aspergillus cavernicola TaxID=176166 RepID=A0ABR4J5R6_9EURO